MRLTAVALCFLCACSPSKQQPQPAAPAKPDVFKVDPATAAVVKGAITFAGKPPASRRINIDEDEECVRLNPKGLYDESVVVGRRGALANVFVQVKSGLEGKTFEPATAPVTLDQKGCRFSPRVLGVRPGQIFTVTNSDPVTHNVHPIAKVNREWNQSQSPGDPPIQRRFARPEMIRIKCNVHSWMRAWAGAVDHPYFAVTGAGGTFEIPNLPPGDYVLEAWHEVFGAREQRVHLAPSAAVAVNFTFHGEK